MEDTDGSDLGHMEAEVLKEHLPKEFSGQGWASRRAKFKSDSVPL